MFKLVKRNKRLVILDGFDRPVYTPPNFLRFKVQSRDGMQAIVDAFNLKESYDITSIIEFESQFTCPKKRKSSSKE